MLREALAALALLAVAYPAVAGAAAYEIDGYTGHVAVGPNPTRLVVFGHGYGYQSADWTHHVEAAAATGAVAVAMDYDNWDLDHGADALVAAAEDLSAAHGITEVAIFGVSMGGAATGLALQRAPAGLFDLWWNVEGAANLFETYAEANAAAQAAPIAKQSVLEIEAECGGTAPAPPACLAERSAVLHAGTFAAKGLQAAVLVHAVNDGLVPYNQGVEMTTALEAAGIPVDFTTVLRGDPNELGTTGTQYVGAKNVANLAGHATETSTTHPVMRAALDSLHAWLAGGAAPGAALRVLDAGVGTLP